MNMYKCVCVSLVLLKGNWQFWKLKASLCQLSAVEESSPAEVCGDPPACVLWPAPESRAEDGIRSTPTWGLSVKCAQGILQARIQ